jgi:hypothetical protein
VTARGAGVPLGLVLALLRSRASRSVLLSYVEGLWPGPRAVLDARQLALPLRLSLPVLSEGPATGPLLPWEHVRCRMGGMLSVSSCLTMRSRVWPSGRRKGAVIRLDCVGCELGVDYARRCDGFVPPRPSQAAEVLSPTQRRAKARWLSSRVWQDDGDHMSPFAEAAALTPDDNDMTGDR